MSEAIAPLVDVQELASSNESDIDRLDGLIAEILSGADADQGISGGYCINDAVSVIDKAAVGIRGTAAYVFEVFICCHVHFSTLLLVI